MQEAIQPKPPALEMAATKSADEIHIIVPPIIGYLIFNISVIFVWNMNNLLF
jgi:hypothetical protein